MSTIQVKPNENFLKLLTEMGISEQVAEHALICTGNDSVEAAMTFLYDNPEIDYSELTSLTNVEQNASQSNNDNVQIDKNDKLLMSEASGEGDSDEQCKDQNCILEDDDDDDQYKMVFLVNSALKMGTGKIAAQVAHACLGLYNILLDHNQTTTAVDIWQSEGKFVETQRLLLADGASKTSVLNTVFKAIIIVTTINHKEKKIVLKAQNHLQMKELQKKAENLRLFTYMVRDAGRTQVTPGSCTVLAIFGGVTTVDEVTGDLNLL